MKFNDFSKLYNSIYPKAQPVTSKIIQTATVPKDIEKEIDEEIVDNSSVICTSVEPEPTPPEDTEEGITDGN